MKDTPSWLEEQADLLAQNVEGWETSVLERIGKRIRKIGRMTAADAQALNNIADVKGDMKTITKSLATLTGENIAQIEALYEKVISEQHDNNFPLYDYRNKKFVPLAENRRLQAIVRAYARSTGETMLNLSKTSVIGFSDAAGHFTSIEKAYTDVLDKAVMQVSSNATDFYTAMRGAITELGGSGIRVNYGSGITRRLDTVVRQTLLWGAKQASNEYNKLIGEEIGCDGIEIDWHWHPRPSHEFMQGRQYATGKEVTIDGKIYPSADDRAQSGEYGISVNEALADYGCLHYPTSIICGVSVPAYSEEELNRLNAENARQFEIGDKTQSGYEWKQDMRKLETEIRKQKSEKAILKASGDKEGVQKCDKRIKKCMAKYKEISEATGITGEPQRMRA